MTTVFEVSVGTSDHDSLKFFGTYATRNLAEQLRNLLMANWPAKPGYPVFPEAFQIREVPVQTKLPDVQLWHAMMSVLDPTNVVTRAIEPSLAPVSNWWLDVCKSGPTLSQVKWFLNHPPEFVQGSGSTEAQALDAARAAYANALKAGVPQHLETSTELLVQLNTTVEALARKNAVIANSLEFYQLQEVEFEKVANEFLTTLKAPLPQKESYD